MAILKCVKLIPKPFFI